MTAQTHTPDTQSQSQRYDRPDKATMKGGEGTGESEGTMGGG